MPNFTDNVNVILSFEGLAFRNFNGNNWEFLFLRDIAQHDLKLTINNSKSTAGKGADPKKMKKIDILIPREHDILIEAPFSQEVYNGEIEYKKGNPHIESDKEDIRWTDDYLYGFPYPIGSFPASQTPLKLNPNKLSTDNSFININGNCVLYTKDLQDQKYEIWEQTGDTKRLVETRKVGAKIGGAMIYPTGESVYINIRGKINQTIEIPIEEGVTTNIDFDNTCQGNPAPGMTSDFEYYFNYFYPSNRKIEIIPIQTSGKPGGRANCKVASPPPGDGGTLRPSRPWFI